MVFFLSEYVTFQIMILVAMNGVMLIYAGSKPYLDPVQNRQNMFNEFLISMHGLCLFYWTGWLPSKAFKVRQYVAFLSLSLLALVVSCNFLLVVVNLVYDICLLLKKYCFNSLSCFRKKQSETEQ